MWYQQVEGQISFQVGKSGEQERKSKAMLRLMLDQYLPFMHASPDGGWQPVDTHLQPPPQQSSLSLFLFQKQSIQVLHLYQGETSIDLVPNLTVNTRCFFN